MTTPKNCSYCNPDGWQCSEPANESGLCYWHDPTVDKSQDEGVKDAVEKWAKAGKPLDGFQLARTQLEDINLVNRGSKRGYQCREADFLPRESAQCPLFWIRPTWFIVNEKYFGRRQPSLCTFRKL